MQTQSTEILVTRCKGITEAVNTAKANGAKFGYAGAYIDNEGYVIVSAVQRTAMQHVKP